MARFALRPLCVRCGHMDFTHAYNAPNECENEHCSCPGFLEKAQQCSGRVMGQKMGGRVRTDIRQCRRMTTHPSGRCPDHRSLRDRQEG